MHLLRHFSVFFVLLISGWLGHASAARLQSPPANPQQLTLFPALHPSHNKSLSDHLMPNRNKSLYYAQEGHRSHQPGSKHAEVNMEFNEEAVVLEHSDQIASVKCTAGDMKVCFKTMDAFSLAQQSWHSSGAPLILVTYHPGCGNTVDGTRSFFLSNDSTFDSATRCAVVTHQELPHDEAINAFDLQMGTWQTAPASVPQPDPEAEKLRRRQEDTVDITRDVAAVQRFFNIILGDPSKDRTGPDPDVPVDQDGNIIEKRASLLSILVDGLVTVATGIKNFFQLAADKAEDLYEKIKAGVVRVGDLIDEGFHHEFNKSYHRPNFTIDIGSTVDQTNATVSKPSRALFGLGEGLALNGIGADISVQCIACGMKSSLQVDAAISFSLANGLKSGNLDIDLGYTQVLMQFGITFDGKVAKNFEKDLFTLTAPGFGIPYIIDFGPMFTGSVALNLALEGSIQFLIGGKFEIQPGGYHFNLKDDGNNGLRGLESKFTPLAKANGSLTGTLDIGFPLKVGFGITILNGLAKRTVALVEHPSVFAAVTTESNGNCKGLDFSVGLKNRIYLAFETASQTISNLIPTYEIWTKNATFPLGCVSLEGIGDAVPGTFDGGPPLKIRDIGPTISTRQDGNTTDPFEAVSEAFPDGTYDQAYQLATGISIPTGIPLAVSDKSYRILMDDQEEGILVSGTDDFLYMAPADNPDFDVSAPFGGSNSTPEVLLFDVFERVLHYDPSQLNLTGLSLIGVTDPTVIPEPARSIALVSIATDSDAEAVYVAKGVEHDNPLALILCSIRDQDSKVLALDMAFEPLGLDLPLDALNLGLYDLYIGGEVEKCGLLKLVSQKLDDGLLV